MQSNISNKKIFDKKKTLPIARKRPLLHFTFWSGSPGTKNTISRFWIDRPYVVEKVLLENYIVSKMNTNKTQILHRTGLLEFTTDTPLEDSCTNEKHRPDDDIVVPQLGVCSTDWKAESNPSVLDQNKSYCDPVTIEQTDSQDSVTQRSVDGNFPQKHDFVSKNWHTFSYWHSYWKRCYVKILSRLKSSTRYWFKSMSESD